MEKIKVFFIEDNEQNWLVTNWLKILSADEKIAGEHAKTGFLETADCTQKINEADVIVFSCPKFSGAESLRMTIAMMARIDKILDKKKRLIVLLWQEDGWEKQMMKIQAHIGRSAFFMKKRGENSVKGINIKLLAKMIEETVSPPAR